MSFSRYLIFVMLALLVSCGGGGGNSVNVNFSAIVGLSLDNPASPTKLYVANADNQTIQVVNLSTNVVTVLAGATNVPGSSNGLGAAARFNEPFGITMAGTDLYVADTYNYGVRKLTTAGTVTTVAGALGSYGASDGTGTSAVFGLVKNLVSDGANLYVTDSSNHTIRQVALGTGAVTTLAGYAGTSGTADGNGAVARFNQPFAIALAGGSLFVTDTHNHTIRQVTLAGTVTTLAGTAGTLGATDASGTSAKFNYPTGIASDGTNLYVADTENHVIRKIVISTGAVSTLAGGTGVSGLVDGIGLAARFYFPIGLALDSAGNLYVTDQNYTKIRKVVVSTGAVSTLAATF